MTITKVLIAPPRAFRASAQFGGRVAAKVAHCVGDVDKGTISENLGAGDSRTLVEDRGHKRTIQSGPGGRKRPIGSISPDQAIQTPSRNE